MANKITKRTVIEAMLADEAIKVNEMFVNYLAHELELLDNKKDNKKMTTTQKENVGIKNEILALLETCEDENGMTCTEIAEKGDFSEKLSNQKVSSLCRQLLADGKIVRTEIKKKAYFKIAEKGE